ncbi:MAG: DMT family transporter [Bacteroidota bacterium]
MNTLSWNRLMPHFALVAVALAYAFNFFIAKWVFSQDIGVLGVVAIRNIFGTSFFWLVAGLFTKEKVTDRKDLLRLAICSVFGIVINQLMFFAGLDKTTELNASVLMITSPVFVFLISLVFRTEKITWLKFVGLILSFFGAALLILSGRSLDLGKDTWIGDIMVAINSGSYGVYLVLVKPLVIKYHPLTIVKWVFLMGGFVIIPVGASDLMAVDWSTFPAEAYWGLAYIIVFTTLLTYSFNAYALSKVSTSAVAIYIYLQPVIVAFLSFFWDKGDLTGEKLLYIFLVFVGVFAVTYRKKTI